MEKGLTTKQAAQLLGVNYSRITKAIFDGQVETPQKIGQAYLWGKDDIERLSWAIRKKSADDIFPSEKKQFLS